MTVYERARPLVVHLTRRVAQDLPNLLSLLVFFSATAFVFRSVEFALVVTASLGFHELGHVALLARFRLEWRIYFGLVGAWTWSPGYQRARLSELANAAIHLAGPLFSLLLALVALCLHAVWQPASDHLLILANFSAQVGFINLLPIGPVTDGGKIARRLIASLRAAQRRRAALLPVAVTAGMVLLYAFVDTTRLKPGSADPIPFLLGLLLVGVWMAGGLLAESSRSAPEEPAPQKAMTPRQVYFLILVIWDILVLDLIVIANTPFWLQAKYIIGPLENVGWLVIYLSRLSIY